MTTATKQKERKQKVGLTKAHRVDWRCKNTVSALELGQYGFSGQLIANLTGLSQGQVYYRLRKIGIGLRHYRNGYGKHAERIVKRYTIE